MSSHFSNPSGCKPKCCTFEVNRTTADLTANNLTYQDRTLLEQIASGDYQAFTKLFHQFFQPLRIHAFQLLKSEFWAEEVVQEVFLQLWHNRQALTNVQSPKSYLYTATSHRCLDRIRRQALEIKMQYVASQVLHGFGSNHEENRYDVQQVEQLIHGAIDRLPAQQKRVFILSREEGLSYADIAIRLGISKNTVRNHMVRNLESIRGYLREHGAFIAWLFSIWYLA